MSVPRCIWCKDGTIGSFVDRVTDLEEKLRLAEEAITRTAKVRDAHYVKWQELELKLRIAEEKIKDSICARCANALPMRVDKMPVECPYCRCDRLQTHIEVYKKELAEALLKLRGERDHEKDNG